jgi:protein-S-isoprenylcysteine O-methyltransferase Ste14
MHTQTDIPNLRLELGRWTIKTLIFWAIAAACLFLGAGQLDWSRGWAYLGVYGLIQILNAAVLLPTSPELLVERSKMREGTKAWDKWLASAVALFGPLAIWIVSGIDRRFSWTPTLPFEVSTVALAIVFLGGMLGLWAMASNRFFSSTVRIQAERGHVVVRGGPYRYVRHPGYLGGALFDLATPLALGAIWAFIPALITLGFLVLRTALEDRTLQDELNGYRSYAEKVRYRLLPGIW